MNFIISIINQIDVGSALAIMALVILGLVAAAYKVGGFITRWRGSESEVKKLRKDWDRDIPVIKTQVSVLTERVDSIKENVSTLTDRVDSIKERMGSVLQSVSTSSTVKSLSPVSLTPVGKEISEALGADGIVQEHKTKLQELVNQTDPQTAYDLQRACFSVVENHLSEMLNEEQLNTAKQQAFSRGIPLDNVLAVIGVLLRDALFAERDWSLEDVDKHDPAK